ncbi:MAG TPA: hypothetical protein VGF23_13780 [Gaiellaceae bacterium]
MSTVLASAADERYGYWLLNMVGSVKASSPRTFDRMVLYDLGLSPFQRRLAENVRGVEVRSVPPFVPHWREGRTWKTWIWTHLEAERLFWLDAGLSVLRPLDEALAQVRERGYFVVSQGHPVADSIPSDYYALYDFPRTLSTETTVAGGILGFDRGSDFYERVVVATFDDACRGLSVGFSAGDAERLNTGLDRNAAPTIRDCTHFRWDQTIFNLRLYLAYPNPVVNDLWQYAGWRSRNDHAEQVIWSHRRRGDYAYLARVPYRPAVAPLGKSWGLWFRWRWWARNHSWLFDPDTYLRKAKRIAAAPFSR